MKQAADRATKSIRPLHISLSLQQQAVRSARRPQHQCTRSRFRTSPRLSLTRTSQRATSTSRPTFERGSSQRSSAGACASSFVGTFTGTLVAGVHHLFLNKATTVVVVATGLDSRVGFGLLPFCLSCWRGCVGLFLFVLCSAQLCSALLCLALLGSALLGSARLGPALLGSVLLCSTALSPPPPPPLPLTPHPQSS